VVSRRERIVALQVLLENGAVSSVDDQPGLLGPTHFARPLDGGLLDLEVLRCTIRAAFEDVPTPVWVGDDVMGLVGHSSIIQRESLWPREVAPTFPSPAAPPLAAGTIASPSRRSGCGSIQERHRQPICSQPRPAAGPGSTTTCMICPASACRTLRLASPYPISNVAWIWPGANCKGTTTRCTGVGVAVGAGVGVGVGGGVKGFDGGKGGRGVPRTGAGLGVSVGRRSPVERSVGVGAV